MRRPVSLPETVATKEVIVDYGPVDRSPSVATGGRAPAKVINSAAAIRGRRTLSTAFVRVGPDGHLTVELRDGRVLVLRDVTMRPADYCGLDATGAKPGIRYCGSYADVVAARPGGGPAPGGLEPKVVDPV